MIFGILSFIGIIMFIVFDSITVNDVFETIMLAGMIGQRELNRWSQFSEQKYFFFKGENLKKCF